MRRSLHLVLLLAVVLGIGSSLGAQLQIREIPFESAADVLKGLPDDVYIGEAAGVATNSQGHLFVYTRTGSPQLTLGTERHFHRGAGGAVSSNSTNRAGICASSARVFMGSSSRTRFASMRRTTSGPSTRGPARSSSSTRRDRSRWFSDARLNTCRCLASIVSAVVRRPPRPVLSALAFRGRVRQTDRRRVRQAGKYFYCGRPRELACREVRRKWTIRQVMGFAGHCARPVQRAAFARDGRAGQRVRGGSRERRIQVFDNNGVSRRSSSTPARRGRSASRRSPINTVQLELERSARIRP